jgi:hypothetical protein
MEGALDTALEYHENALKIHKDIGHKQGEAIDLKNIAIVYREKGDSDKAESRKFANCSADW